MARLILVEDIAGPSVLGRGGVAMYVLQWAHGLRRLGHEVLLLEILDEPPPAGAARAFEQLMSGCWRGAPAAMLHVPDRRSGEVSHVAGVSVEQVSAFARRAAAVITLAAHYRAEPWPLIGDVHPRVIVDQDPGYTQLRASEGDPLEVFGEHDLYFTVGANIGGERCRLPTLGIDWRPIYNPVLLDWWNPAAALERDRFTSVISWRDYGYLEFDGGLLGPKVEQFERLLELPRRSGEPIELVVDLQQGDPDHGRLTDAGWLLVKPNVVATPARYRRFIEGSLAELGVAKGGYVGTACGWFSDRSACYLAAGRPVILQSTGFEQSLPTGTGLFAFDTLEQAAEAMARVRRDYARHSAAAREIAREHLAAERVLPALLQAAGLDSAVVR